MDDREEIDNSGLKGDRALAAGGMDRLGFREVAARIAAALIDHASDGGLVVGLDGPWGSGKSSLLYLIQDELDRSSVTEPPTVINFRPWLVASRDSLLTSLFEEFDAGIAQYQAIRGITTDARAERLKRITERLRAFGEGLSKFGDIVEAVGDVVPVPGVSQLGKVLSAARDPLTKDRKPKPLLDLKTELSESLRELGHRFVVTIDDVDRLEPADVVEIMRLVRAVADFPNVVYVLCYDADVLKHSVEAITKVKDGSVFLEKIVQLSVAIPQPEPFALRQWFADELKDIGEPRTEDELARLKSVIDTVGSQYLTTPRSVVRALDAVRFFWPAQKKESIDLADMVWLLLIKNGNPKLYRWIETYCATAAHLSLGTARVEDVERADSLRQLLSMLDEREIANASVRYLFAEQLPGVVPRYTQGVEPFQIYQPMGTNVRDAAIANGRLKSPDHYRYYFALSGPSYALRQADFDAFWSCSDRSAIDVCRLLLEWHTTIVVGTLSKAEILLERISGASPMPSRRASTVLLAFGDSLDEAYWQRPFESFSYDSLWDRAEKLAHRLLGCLNADDRQSLLNQLFGDGRAIGWLTTLVRHETFAHGRYGYRQRPEAERLLRTDEFERVSTIMMRRYTLLTLGQLLRSPSALDVLFAWQQLGDDDGPRKLLQKALSDDALLVDVLGHMRTASRSSKDGLSWKLSRRNVEPFLDCEAVSARLRAIASGESVLAEKAQEWAHSLEQSD